MAPIDRTLGPRPPKGTGALITGITLVVSCGLPATALGMVAIERVEQNRSIFFQDGGSVATLAFGLSSLAVGIPLTVWGTVRRTRYNEWRRRRHVQVVPELARTAYGTTTAGLTLRF